MYVKRRAWVAMLAAAAGAAALDDSAQARRRFSPEQKRTLQRLLGAALAERGYPPATD